MAKQTKCVYCLQMVDNRAIKAHERAHEKAGDQKPVVTPPFSDRLKEARQKVEARITDELVKTGTITLEQASEIQSLPVPKAHPKTYNHERRQKIAELREQGLGYRKIGQRLGLHPVRVRKICKELGI